MKKPKILLLLISLVMVLTVLTGCSSKKEESEEKTEETTETEDKEQEVVGFASPKNNGALHVEESNLVDEDGNIVQLRGVSTHGISWFPQYIDQNLFHALKTEWKANVIRLAMYPHENGGYCTDGNQEELKQKIRDGVSYAKNADMYVIIDWHVLNEQNPLTYKDQAIAFFEDMSKEFSSETHVIYEICNEPNGDTEWKDVKAYANEVIPVIQANDEDAVILVGTPNWSQDIDEAASDPLEYDNVMYTFHYYAATHKDDMQDKLKEALDEGLPVFVSEYGICESDGNGTVDIEEAEKWLELLNKYHVSFVQWNLSNKDEASSLIKSSCTTTGISEADLTESGTWLYTTLREMANVKDGETFVCNGVTVEMEKVNSWEEEGKTFTHYIVTLSNDSDADMISWNIEIPFKDHFVLEDCWNGNYRIDGKTLKISNVDYNGNIVRGGKIYHVGFIVSGSIADVNVTQ